MLGNLLDGRYRVSQILSAGGFGETYIAEDTRRPGNPRCVLKLLKPASSDPEYLKIARRLFNSEAETLEQLGKHDQIPQLLAYFEENEQFYLVQEFIAGHPLNTELQPGQIWMEDRVIQMLQDVLPVLEFVHGSGVIHRDIKPANLIRRQPDGKLVLIDFGAVKQIRTQIAANPEQIVPTVAVGTPGYMPAEQAQGRPRPSSDLYALGMVGIQALTGQLPASFQEDPVTGEVLWEQYARISPGLTAILQKMVRYHYRDRYQSTRDALQDLRLSLNPSFSTQPIANPILPPTEVHSNTPSPSVSVPFSTSSPYPATPSSPYPPTPQSSTAAPIPVTKLNAILSTVRFVPFVGAAGVMLFGGTTWITLLAVGLIAAGIGLFSLRSLYPHLARDYDAVFAVILALAGGILLFQDHRIDEAIPRTQYLLAGASIYAAIEAIQQRSLR
ncbi:MAG: protein kinase [Cyanobacteria bacterium RU_5_0]|nr:protein kinase [Cyanobacteria bacterium RU_5_0]